MQSYGIEGALCMMQSGLGKHLEQGLVTCMLLAELRAMDKHLEQRLVTSMLFIELRATSLFPFSLHIFWVEVRRGLCQYCVYGVTALHPIVERRMRTTRASKKQFLSVLSLQAQGTNTLPSFPLQRLDIILLPLERERGGCCVEMQPSTHSPACAHATPLEGTTTHGLFLPEAQPKRDVAWGFVYAYALAWGFVYAYALAWGFVYAYALRWGFVHACTDLEICLCICTDFE
eukprot:scaffold93454_cov20-Tisochrysis_lutea.AAC.3